MNVFWRKEPLSEPEYKLLNLCLEAHGKSSFRDNISTNVLKNTALGSLNYTSAISAALCSLGGVHAPLLQSVSALMEPIENVRKLIEMGGKVPGWGSSFEKDGVDPIWAPLADHIAKEFPEVNTRIDEITQELHKRGKKIYPNPSIFTAATGLILHIPAPIIPWLFIHGRLVSWTTMFYSAIMSKEDK